MVYAQPQTTIVAIGVGEHLPTDVLEVDRLVAASGHTNTPKTRDVEKESLDVWGTAFASAGSDSRGGRMDL